MLKLKEIAEKSPGAYAIRKPKKYLFVKENYKEIIKNILEAIKDSRGELPIMKIPWIVIGFAGFEEEMDTYEEVVESMKKLTLSHTSTVGIILEKDELKRIYCKRAEKASLP